MSGPLKPLFDLRALWFVLFYVALALVYRYKSRALVKKSFVTGFFTLLLVVSLAGTHFFPFMVWDKFPNTYPQTETDYQLTVITEDGEELAYDFRGTLGSDGVYEPYLTPRMATEYSHCKNIRIMKYLFQRAQIHRDRVEERSILVFTRFPPHGLVDMWTKRELSTYGKFTSLRLYKQVIHSSEDGTRVTNVTRDPVVTYNASAEYDCQSNQTTTPRN